MQELTDVIRASLASDATKDQKAAGVHACRTIATALDTEPGTPMPLAIALPTRATPHLSIDQVLEFVVARLGVIAKSRDDEARASSTGTPAEAVAPIVPQPSPQPPSGLRIPMLPSVAPSVTRSRKGVTPASRRVAPRPVAPRRSPPSRTPDAPR